MTTPLSAQGQAVYLTPFIGRQADLHKMLDLLQDPSVRLVTILGAGGIGKTRFALEVASFLEDQYQQGIIFVPLAPLNKADDFLPAFAKVLGVPLPPGDDPVQAVLNRLGDQQRLLIFDNFENLPEAAIYIREILVARPQVKALVTSREKLDLESENLFHLSGLQLPRTQDLEKAVEYDSVSLFMQKARQVQPGFSLNAENIADVIHICKIVDGNPLGILLAAAWVEYFSPAEIVDQIHRSLDFLTQNWRDAEPRHVGMRAVFDSSFQRLNEPDKAVFRKLAVFRGGFDLDAAQPIAGADLRSLLTLVNKSLLSRDPSSSRYDVHELLRQFAGEELAAANEHEHVRMAYALFYIAFVQQREPRLISPKQTIALDEIQADFENIRQAVTMSIENRDFASARHVLPGLYAFCDMRSRFYEGEAIFWQAVVGLAPHSSESPQPAWALALLSWYDLRTYHKDFETFDKVASQANSCLDFARSINDQQGIAASLVLLGAIAEDQGDFESAIRKYEQAMQTDPSLDDVYWVNMRIGICYQAAHQYPKAIQAFHTCLERSIETGERVKTAWSLVNIGDTLLLQRKASEAEDYIEQAGALFQKIGTRFGVLSANFSMSRVALELGDPQEARGYAEIANQIAREIHSVNWIRKTAAWLEQIDSEPPRSPLQKKGQEQENFSERELEVLQLLKSEMSGPEIARRLYISLNTVRYHTKNIYQKLGVNTRLEAIQRARELGL